MLKYKILNWIQLIGLILELNNIIYNKDLIGFVNFVHSNNLNRIINLIKDILNI